MSQQSDTAVTSRPRTRDKNRKDKILLSARQLFRSRGFHAVGIDEIGEAAGITGPGVYRHFDSKEDLLAAAIDGAGQRLWRELEIDLETDGEATPEEVLEALVRSHVRFAITESDLVALWYQEWRNLPAQARLEQRRAQRRYIQWWIEVVLTLQPELGDMEARTIVHGAIGLIHSLCHYENVLDAEKLEETLTRMALAALTAQPAPREMLLEPSP